MDHSSHYCLVIVVLTHGGVNGLLYAHNSGFTRDDLWTPFTADKCPSLAEKPKLFFIQVNFRLL